MKKEKKNMRKKVFRRKRILKKLSWNGSCPGTLENRKYKHLSYLFEATDAVSICKTYP
jgi:hypothetical protein